MSAKLLVQNCISAKLAVNWDQFKEKGFLSALQVMVNFVWNRKKERRSRKNRIRIDRRRTRCVCLLSRGRNGRYSAKNSELDFERKALPDGREAQICRVRCRKEHFDYSSGNPRRQTKREASPISWKYIQEWVGEAGTERRDVEIWTIILGMRKKTTMLS